VYAFLLVFSIRTVRDLFMYMWAYVISCGILSFFALFVFGLSKNNSAVTRLDNLYTYDANDICVVMMVGLALTLLLLQVSKGTKRFALIINLVGIGVTIARSGSRGGFIGLVAFAAVGLFLINSVSFGRRSMILGVVSLALMIGAPPGYWEQMQTVLAPKDDYNYSSRDGRKALAERGIGYTMQYPIFGLGIDNFSRAECTISSKLADMQVSRGVRVRCAPPHNSFVQAAAETGVPGFLVWLSLIVGGIASMLSLRGRMPQRWRTGNDIERFLYGSTHFIVLALVGFSATAFFVSFAWMDILYIVAAFMAGLIISVQAYKAELAGNTGAPVAAPSKRGWRSRRPFGSAPQPMSRR
jgi:O-antigen ligase